MADNSNWARALQLINTHRFTEAVEVLQLALADEPERVELLHLQAICLRQLDKLPEATELARRAIALDPDNDHGHWVLGTIWLARGRPAQALEAVGRAIAANPDDADYYSLRAQAQINLKQWNAALQSASEGLAIDPEHANCSNFRAIALTNLGRREEATQAMTQTLARTPEDPLSHANLGWTLLHQGQPRKAAEHFREALRLDPENEWARAGILEALKARNPFYRLMLAYLLWMSRLGSQTQWMIVIGIWMLTRSINGLRAALPAWELPLSIVYFSLLGFAFSTWFAGPFFNLMLRLDRFGRHVLSADERAGGTAFGLGLIPIVLCAGLGLYTGNGLFQLLALMYAVALLPISAIWSCERGWPRQIATGLGVLMAAFPILISTMLVWPALANMLPMLGGKLFFQYFSLLAIGSMFAVNYLQTVHVKR